jgi:uncharacterized protein
VAVRAGIEVEIPVRARAEVLHLPTVGSCPLPGGEGVVVAGPGGFALRSPDGPTRRQADVPGWAASRWIPLDRARLLIEDADPHRGQFGAPVTGPLDEDDLHGWAGVLTAAEGELATDAPDQLGGLLRGLRAITPLVPAADGAPRSVTARHAPGAVAIAYAGDPSVVAVALVHEFQHTKLGALLDLVDLVADTAAGDELTVGWRPEPRPVGRFCRVRTPIWRSPTSGGAGPRPGPGTPPSATTTGPTGTGPRQRSPPSAPVAGSPTPATGSPPG